MKSNDFHSDRSALISARVDDAPVSTPGRFHPSYEAGIINPRYQPKKLPPSSFKHNKKTNANSNTPLHYVPRLDKTRMPTFYDADHHLTPFTSTDVTLWLRRLHVLYRIDQERYYGEVIDLILSVLQFVPAIYIDKSVYKITPSYSSDTTMVNDIVRARMHMLEQYTSDGNVYRSVNLTVSYRVAAMNASVDNTESSNVINTTIDNVDIHF